VGVLSGDPAPLDAAQYNSYYPTLTQTGAVQSAVTLTRCALCYRELSNFGIQCFAVLNNDVEGTPWPWPATSFNEKFEATWYCFGSATAMRKLTHPVHWNMIHSSSSQTPSASIHQLFSTVRMQYVRSSGRCEHAKQLPPSDRKQRQRHSRRGGCVRSVGTHLVMHCMVLPPLERPRQVEATRERISHVGEAVDVVDARHESHRAPEHRIVAHIRVQPAQHMPNECPSKKLPGHVLPIVLHNQVRHCACVTPLRRASARGWIQR
jgi:hypothetical protein